jgi:fatty-acyl-CoA synthase
MMPNRQLKIIPQVGHHSSTFFSLLDGWSLSRHDGGVTSISVFDWIAHHNDLRPNKLAVVCLGAGDGGADTRFSYSQLHQRTDALAAHLRSTGVNRGDRVAVLALNGNEYLEAQFACGRIGAIAVLLNWRLTVPELEYICNDSTPKFMIHDISLATMATQLQSLCNIGELLCIDRTSRPNRPNSDNPYEVALVAATKQATSPFVREELTHDDPWAIMYTSGTTGHPKGAIITHGMTFWNCINLGIPARITTQTVQLCVLPLFHTGGLNCYTNPVLHAGGTVIIAKAFDPGESLRVLGDPQLGVTHFFAVPAPYQFIMQHPDFESTDLSRLQVAGVGGAPCALTIIEAWAGRGVEIVQGYGMTETSPGSTMLDPADAMRKIGSAGKPLLHTAVRIVVDDGTEMGRDAGSGEVGELWTKGPNITPGYWNRPEATASSFTNGWLKTGDAARLDDEGFIYIVDRWKDMYISGGENVYPAEVENVLFQIPQIADAAVIGIPNDRWGEVGLAVLVLKPDQTIDKAAVVNHCVSRLAKFKVPAEIAIIDVLPRNATGKVLKRELRVQFVGTDAPLIS